MSELSREMPQEIEPESIEGERSLEREIGARYDSLLEERRELMEKLGHFKVREYSVCLQPESVGGERFMDLVDRWEERVRHETSLLTPLDQLGIDIFAEDLTVQPGFPGHEIIFSSEEILSEQVRSMRAVGGWAQRYHRTVDVGLPHPDLSLRLASVMNAGNFPESIRVLVHELVHRHHMEADPSIDSELTEAQAYFSGLLTEGRSNFGLALGAEVLTREKDGGGLYGLEVDRVNVVLAAMAELYGLGLKEDEISRLLSASSFDLEVDRYEPLMTRLDELKKERGLEDDADSMALYDLYRLYAANQFRRARLLLFETVDDLFSPEERRVIKREQMRRQIFSPEYCLGGHPVPARDLWQELVTPLNDKYPYDPDGLRTGIVFGYFPVSDSDPKQGLEFGIGRLEVNGDEGRVDLASQKEELDAILSDLREAMETVLFKTRAMLAINYMESGLLQMSSVALEIVANTIVSDGDRLDLVNVLNEKIGKKIEIVALDASALSHGWRMVKPEISRKKLEDYAIYLESISRLGDLLELDFRTCPELEGNLALLGSAIYRFKKTKTKPSY